MLVNSKVMEFLTKLSKKTLKNLIMIALAASVMMFIIGENDRKLTELKQMCWMPIPIALVLGWAYVNKKDEDQEEKS